VRQQSFFQADEVDVRELQSLGRMERDERDAASFPILVVLLLFLSEHHVVEEAL
jgi:hypothetical protein